MLDISAIEEVREGQKIDRPGLYRMPMHIYHSDCCAGPSVSSSGIRQFISECPAYYWGLSYMNPEACPQDDTQAFAFGRAAHCLIVGGEVWEESFALCPFDSFRTKAAQEWRDEQIEAGRTVVSQADYNKIVLMAKVMKTDPVVEACGLLDERNPVETSLIWRDRTGLWLKARPDVLTLTGVAADYKTSESVSIWGCTKALRNYRYDLQAALVLEGQRAVLGHEDEDFALIFQMKKAPFLVTAVAIDRDTLAAARVELRFALDRMAECFETGQWPGYADAMPSVGLHPEKLAEIQALGEKVAA